MTSKQQGMKVGSLTQYMHNSACQRRRKEQEKKHNRGGENDNKPKLTLLLKRCCGAVATAVSVVAGAPWSTSFAEGDISGGEELPFAIAGDRGVRAALLLDKLHSSWSKFCFWRRYGRLRGFYVSSSSRHSCILAKYRSAYLS